jgi:hypothetical protein
MACDPFDPADWLERFKSAGGWYAAQGDRVHAGWRIDDWEEAQTAREIWREIERHGERRAAIRAVISATGLIAYVRKLLDDSFSVDGGVS